MRKSYSFILVFSILILFSSCEQKKTVKVKNEESQDPKKDAMPFITQNVSLVSLISNPEKFHGKQIRVIGYLNFEFEGNCIFLHKEDNENGITENAFWTDYSNEIISKQNLKKFDKKYVIIEGTFDMNSHGHMGVFAGTIKNINRVDLSYGEMKKEYDNKKLK
jgi:hypothetical protein